MEDARTARNNASESVKNASEVKQAVLKKRKPSYLQKADSRCGIKFYDDDVTCFGLRCKFCPSQTEAYACQLVDKDDGHLVFGIVAEFRVHLKSKTHKEKREVTMEHVNQQHQYRTPLLTVLHVMIPLCRQRKGEGGNEEDRIKRPGAFLHCTALHCT